MIAIIDYGMGNLRSVQKALEQVGAQAIVTSDKAEILKAKKVILPGVGAMRPAMERLKELDLIEPIKTVIGDGVPFLGICLGMQLLFDKSYEGGEVPGLGIVPGIVTMVRGENLKVPHMGWNQLKISDTMPMYQNVSQGSNVYFCHSYFVRPIESQEKSCIASITDYNGFLFVSSFCKDNLWAVQFHPEKSQKVGLTILENFKRL
ncbi:MAG: imidazole glycerol phosphate synthase subunit HisH [Candidatus Omnitrophica bacterium]|nr:imidazole glycerol phosphate synthase subunit HisH [Candidatus Omnitrophota bacterium]